MAISKNLFNMVQKKFHKSSHTDTNLSNTSSSEEAIVREETANFEEDIIASPTPSSSQKKDLTKEDVKAIKIQSFFRGYLARKAFRAPKTKVKRLGKNRMGMPKNCFKMVQLKFGKSSQTNTSPSGSIEGINVIEETTYISEEPNSSASSTQLFQKKDLTKEDIAAIKIQSFSRGHLARKSLRARENIVKSSKKKETGMSQKYFSRVQRKFRKRSQRDITSPQTHTSPNNSTEKSNDQEETIKFEDPNSAASSSSSPQMKDSTKEDVAAIKIQATFQGHRVRQTFRALENIATSSKKKEMGKHQNCFNIVQIRLHKRSHKDKISPHANTSPSGSMEEAIVEKEATNFEDLNGATSSIPSFQRNDLTKEDIAAIKIQAIFRRHRARQILQASESIVTSSEKERVRKPQNYFNIVQRRFRKRSQRDAISSHVNTSPTNSIEKAIVKTESVTFEDPSGAASSAQPSQRKDLTKEDVAAIKIQAIFRGHHARQRFQARESNVTSSKEKRMGKPEKFLKIVQRRLHKRSHRDTISLRTNTGQNNSTEEAIVEKATTNFEDPSSVAIVKKECTNSEYTNGATSSTPTSQEITNFEDHSGVASLVPSSQRKDFNKEDIAAIKIQANFRGHRVRQIFGARERVVTSSKKKRIGKPQNCFNIVQRRVRKRSHRETISPHATTSPSNFTEEAIVKKESSNFEDTSGAPIVKNESTSAASSAPPSQESTNFENSSGATIVKKESTHFEDPKDVASSTPLSQEITNFKDLNGAVSSAPSSQRKDLTKENVAAVKIQAIFRGHRARRGFLSLKSLVPSSRKKENSRRTAQTSQNLFNIVRRKFRKTPHRDIILSHTNTCARSSTDEAIVPEETINFENANGAACSIQLSKKKDLTKEDIAAIKIQTSFRGHLVLHPTRTTGISSTQEPGEAASSGSWGMCEETGTYSPALHARTCSIAG
uniref:Uncharacterized protein n=1 Tax=Quercus lobata TaxID=97700 RepID=A0A7N2M2T3_QUELO